MGNICNAQQEPIIEKQKRKRGGPASSITDGARATQESEYTARTEYMMRDTPEKTPYAEEPQDFPSQNNADDPEQQWLDEKPAEEEKPIDEHPTEEDQEEPATPMTVETPEKADNEEETK